MKHTLALLLLGLCTAEAVDNGLGLLPPLAWRSWNAFHESMNQSTIMDMVDAIVKEREVQQYGDDGEATTTTTTSLQKLGYNMVGIDEGWEGCGMGINHTQHYVNGTPAVRADFPDLKALVDYGHSKGVKMGFYLNGCSCGEHAEHMINYEGDVNFTHMLGFDGVKIDSCGAQRNMTLYGELFNATGRPIMIENCHQGQSFTDGGDPDQMSPGWCPYNTFRTSGDIINVWDRVIENLLSVTKFLTKTAEPGASPEDRPLEPPIWFPPPPPSKWEPSQPLSRPGCWAYPDMLEVGRMEGSGQSSKQMSADESSSHFAGWAIVSAPLVLGFNLANTTRLNLAWPTISNKGAMEVSQCWEKDRVNPSGALLKVWQAETLTAVVANCGPACSSQCVNANVNCTKWAKENQCTENPGYMRAVCAAACPSSSNQTGWALTPDGGVKTPAGDCLDAAGQLPAMDAGLNWLRTAKCNSKSKSQKFNYKDNQLVSVENGACLGVESHWLWSQPMVSLVGCGGAKTNVTLHKNGTISSHTNFGCFGVSKMQGPPSSLWRKPMPNGKTAVLAINGAALPHDITIDFAEVLAHEGMYLDENEATATDIWTGKKYGKRSNLTKTVPAHGNIFITLD